MTSTASHPSLLDLAKQGNAYAIGALINRQLQPKGITAKAAPLEGCLQIMLESAQVPNQQDLVTFIRKGLVSLGAASINQVKVYGRQAGQEIPAWWQDFELKAQVKSIPILSGISPNSSSKQKQQQTLSVNTNQSTVSASNKGIIRNSVNSNKSNTDNPINTSTPWHKTNFGIITFLIICWPCGLYLMWRHGKWSDKARWSVTGTLAILCLINFGANQQASTSITEAPSSPSISKTSTVVDPSFSSSDSTTPPALSKASTDCSYGVCTRTHTASNGDTDIYRTGYGQSYDAHSRSYESNGRTTVRSWDSEGNSYSVESHCDSTGCHSSDSAGNSCSILSDGTMIGCH